MDRAGLAGQDPTVRVKVTSDPISVSECETLPQPFDGAAVIFCGMVRDHTEGRPVSALTYEAYSRMAEEQMRNIGQQARTEFGATAVLLAHRTGNLQVGEISVITAVSAPHRDDAFKACRFCIDAIKEKAAIWKKETFVDGGSRWVGRA